jgi:YHS domain-containing protein
MSGELLILGGLGLLLLLMGGDVVVQRFATAARADQEHQDTAAHPSAHGGIIQPLGKRHAEAVLESGGKVRLYLLDSDPSLLYSLPAPALAADVQPDGAPDVTALELKPKSLPGEPSGTASCFTGQLPSKLQGQPFSLSVTIPLEGRAYRARFALGGAGHGDPQAGMPAAVPQDRESKLFLTPGGRYTEADILANGGVTPTVKLRDFVPVHDMHPKPGDRICPITATKAAPSCSWIIGGETYQFCCPPCMQEFMKQVKEKPEKVRPAASYVKS